MDSSEPVKVIVRLTADDARMWAIGVARECGLKREGTDKLVQSLNLERLLAMLLDNPDDARRYVGVTCAMLRKDFAHENEEEGANLMSIVIAPQGSYHYVLPQVGTHPRLSFTIHNHHTVAQQITLKTAKP
jgi:hypothetical protein